MRLTREHLHYLEEADICHRLTEDGFTKEQLARCLGKTPALVAQKLRLAGLEPELRAFLMEQNLPEGYAGRCPSCRTGPGAWPLPAGHGPEALRAGCGAAGVRGHCRLPVPPPIRGRTISLMRDHRLYLNAIQAIIAQMRRRASPPR